MGEGGREGVVEDMKDASQKKKKYAKREEREKRKGKEKESGTIIV